MKDLAGKIALVTGASRGIGKAISEQLAKEKAKVVMIASTPGDLESAAEAIRRSGGQVEPFVCDLKNIPQFLDLLKEIEQKIGPIDILVNNVGTGTFKPLNQTSFEELMLPLKLPLEITLAACHAVIPKMISQRSGHVVIVSSPAGYFCFPNMSSYMATRWALVGLAFSLYEEARPYDVGVSLICPGAVNTSYFERNDADMRWWPRVSRFFSAMEPVVVGAKVVQAIRNNQREVIFPWYLAPMIYLYRMSPSLNNNILKMFGLFRPSIPTEQMHLGK